MSIKIIPLHQFSITRTMMKQESKAIKWFTLYILLAVLAVLVVVVKEMTGRNLAAQLEIVKQMSRQ